MSFIDRVHDWFESFHKHDEFYEATVKKDGSLWQIAKDASDGADDPVVQRHVDELIKLNPEIGDPNVVQVGDKVKVPLEWERYE